MHKLRECNFAGRVVERLRGNSCLVDASTTEIIPSGDLPGLIVGFAATFRSAGLQQGDRMVIGCGLNPATVVAYLGAIYAGLVPVLVDEQVLGNAGAVMLASAGAKALWTREKTRYDWAEGNGTTLFHGVYRKSGTRFLKAAPVAEDDIAVLMPTSGSTGAPRLVMVTHRNLIANTEAIIRSQDLAVDETAMLIMPVSYCFGASIVHTHLYQGGSIVFDSRFMFPDKVLRALDTYGCTTFAGVPTVYNILLRRSNIRSLPLGSLRRFLQAGGALAPESVCELRHIAPQAEFFAMYGQTEATSRIACLRVSHFPDKIGSVGAPLDNLTIRIADEYGQEVSKGQTGEIQVKGPSVCAGYANDKEATAAKFGSGWLRTGDFACMDDAGFLWIRGRTDEFVKMRGVRVSLGEIEARVSSVAGVFECAVKRIDHTEAGEALMLFIVANEGADGVVQRVRRALPPHWTCASIDLISGLPKTANGKIARSRLGAIA